MTEIPLELMRDPTCWLEAQKVEEFLAEIDSWSLSYDLGHSFLQQIGHTSRDLKSWGVLDSVLRMIDKPQDIFLQPQRFISYFISPAPPVGNIQRNNASVAFDIPVSFEEYPNVATYLTAAIESVPLFMGHTMASAKWLQNHIVVDWSESQSLLESCDLSQRQMAPEVVRNLISTLEKTEQALLEKTRELEKIKSENLKAAQSLPIELRDLSDAAVQTQAIISNIGRLQDYFTRASQLVTMLVGQDRMSKQIQNAMKRVNWDNVKDNFPKTIDEISRQVRGEKIAEHKDEQQENSFYENQISHQSRDSGQSWFSHS